MLTLPAKQPAEPLDDLRAALANADDEVWRIQMADNYCMTNGAYDRALNVRRHAEQALAEAELAEAMTDPAFLLATSNPEARA